jgi:hypothetical protein
VANPIKKIPPFYQRVEKKKTAPLLEQQASRSGGRGRAKRTCIGGYVNAINLRLLDLALEVSGDPHRAQRALPREDCVRVEHPRLLPVASPAARSGTPSGGVQIGFRMPPQCQRRRRAGGDVGVGHGAGRDGTPKWILAETGEFLEGRDVLMGQKWRLFRALERVPCEGRRAAFSKFGMFRESRACF